MFTVAGWDSMGRVITKHVAEFFKYLAELFKLSAEHLVFSEPLEGSTECFKSSAEPFKGSVACFETNAQLSLLINGHMKSY